MICYLGRASSHQHQRRLSDFCEWKNKIFLWGQLAAETSVFETRHEIRRPEKHYKKKQKTKKPQKQTIQTEQRIHKIRPRSTTTKKKLISKQPLKI